jgi:hypothetical protein
MQYHQKRSLSGLVQELNESISLYANFVSSHEKQAIEESLVGLSPKPEALYHIFGSQLKQTKSQYPPTSKE